MASPWTRKFLSFGIAAGGEGWYLVSRNPVSENHGSGVVSVMYGGRPPW